MYMYNAHHPNINLTAIRLKVGSTLQTLQASPQIMSNIQFVILVYVMYDLESTEFVDADRSFNFILETEERD